jgi:hypothetical protein
MRLNLCKSCIGNYFSCCCCKMLYLKVTSKNPHKRRRSRRKFKNNSLSEHCSDCLNFCWRCREDFRCDELLEFGYRKFCLKCAWWCKDCKSEAYKKQCRACRKPRCDACYIKLIKCIAC